MGKYRRILKLILGIIALVTFFACQKVSAASYVANYVGATVSGNWVKVSSSGNVSIEVVPADTGAMALGKHSISVETNAVSGYRLYVSGIDNDTDNYTALYKDGDKQASSKIYGFNVTTPSSFNATNTWGYAVPGKAGFSGAAVYDSLMGETILDQSKINSLTWLGLTQNYQPIASSNSSNEGSPTSTDVYYGVYVDNNIIKGAYRNAVVYTAFVEGGDSISVSPAIVSDNTTITITTEHQGSVNPITPDRVNVKLYDERDKTKEIGACEDITIIQDGVNEPLAFSCVFREGPDALHGTEYNIDVQVDAKDNGIYLTYTNNLQYRYDGPTLAEITYMQDVTANICAVTPTWEQQPTTYTLIDNRDDKQYSVRRLKDGECWMVQSLDLDLAIEDGLESADGGQKMGTLKLGTNEFVPFTNQNTDIAAESWTIPVGSQGYKTQDVAGVYWNSTGCANANSNTTWSESTAGTDTYCDIGYEIRSMDNGNLCGRYYGDGSPTQPDGIDADYCQNVDVGQSDPKHIGNYYNWPAATAGTGTSQTTPSQHADGSICPKGWTLPKLYDEKSTWLMINTYMDANLPGWSSMTPEILAVYHNEFSLFRAGVYKSTTASIESRGWHGSIWTSRATTEMRAVATDYGNDILHIDNHRLMGDGLAIRCLVK